MDNDILQVQGINSKGFGIIPKIVMQDKRLTIQAKSIYSYFCSYAGTGKTAFPKRDKIISDLGISKDTYYKHFALLRDCGYIKAEQEHKGGRLTRNIYTLVQEIQRPKFSDTEIQDTEILCPKIQDTEKQDTVFQDTINNNRSKNKQSFKNNREGENMPMPVQKYGEFNQVHLTAGQYDTLVTTYGIAKTTDYINRLDLHIESKGNAFKNHYATIKKWITGDDAKSVPTQPKPKQSKYANFKQRKYDFGVLEQQLLGI